MNRKGIGYSELSEHIYMGTINYKKHCRIGTKIDITNNFIDTLFDYIPTSTSRIIKTGQDRNIFINIKIDKESIDKAIKYLNSLVTDIK